MTLRALATAEVFHWGTRSVPTHPPILLKLEGSLGRAVRGKWWEVRFSRPGQGQGLSVGQASQSHHPQGQGNRVRLAGQVRWGGGQKSAVVVGPHLHRAVAQLDGLVDALHDLVEACRGEGESRARNSAPSLPQGAPEHMVCRG